MQGYKLLDKDGKARVGEFHTAHGMFETPAFMPVGTQATVKGVNPQQLREIGAQIILSNTYHLHLRPTDLLIKDQGGLHKFMGWNGPILTDSGGYQVFSLAKLRKISEQGVEFQSHHDGRKIFFSPEKVIEIQENLGVDIMMVLDECLPYPSKYEDTRTSLELTTAWAKRSRLAKTRTDNFMFGIVQGGMFADLRIEAAERLIEINFDGYAIGGLSVGEPTDIMINMVQITAPVLPEDKIRYLMGVGTPRDLVNSVAEGIDLFDCVIPTRSARFGRLYVDEGYINIKNERFRSDSSPISKSCDCYSCQNFSKSYISHLIHANELLGLELASLHNLRFYQRLMQNVRNAIRNKQFTAFANEFLSTHVYPDINDEKKVTD